MALNGIGATVKNKVTRDAAYRSQSIR